MLRRAKEQAAEDARQHVAEQAAAQKAAARQALGPEPPAGQGVAQIRLRFRDGSQLQRRFHAAQPLQVGLAHLTKLCALLKAVRVQGPCMAQARMGL